MPKKVLLLGIDCDNVIRNGYFEKNHPELYQKAMQHFYKKLAQDIVAGGFTDVKVISASMRQDQGLDFSLKNRYGYEKLFTHELPDITEKINFLVKEELAERKSNAVITIETYKILLDDIFKNLELGKSFAKMQDAPAQSAIVVDKNKLTTTYFHIHSAANEYTPEDELYYWLVDDDIKDVLNPLRSFYENEFNRKKWLPKTLKSFVLLYRDLSDLCDSYTQIMGSSDVKNGSKKIRDLILRIEPYQRWNRKTICGDSDIDSLFRETVKAISYIATNVNDIKSNLRVIRATDSFRPEITPKMLRQAYRNNNSISAMTTSPPLFTAATKEMAIKNEEAMRNLNVDIVLSNECLII